LTDLAGALAAMYQAGGPAPGAAPGDFVGPAVNRAAYQTLIHASKSLTGATSDDVNGLADSITALASWLTAGDLERRAYAWLQASVQHGQIFPAVGQLLGSFDEEFSGEDGRLVFRPTSALDVSLGRDANGAFELRVQPRVATESIDYVLGAAVTLDVSGAAAPRVQLTASGGLTEAARRTLAGAGIDVQPQLDLGLALDASLSVTATAAFYPIGDRTFAAELLPTPRLTYESHTLDAPSWLLRLAPRVLLPLVENSVLNRADVKAALEYPLLDFSLAKLLSRLALLRQRDGRYALGEWSAFADLSASAVLTALIDSVQADETQAQADGVHFIALKNGAATDYGIRIRLKDVPLGGKDSGRTLQAGSWLSGETDASNWLVESGGPAGATPGAELLLCRRTNGSISFDAARIALTSVGLDLEGKAFAGGRKPLVEFGGYALRGLKSRVFLTIDASGAQFGGAIELHEVSMPLGPQAGGEAGSRNPVAANLLASESAADGAAQEAVNPAFSALVAHRDRFYGKVFVANGTPSADGKVWIPIQRTFGPLRCRQIGVGITDEPRLEIGYDGGVSLSALAIDLQDLTISIPLRDPGNVGAYGLDLGGLNFSLAADAVQVSGGLSRIVDEDGRPRYDGMALIKAQDFTITGFGSYAMANDAPSLFIFAVLHKDLGGPAFFHVTGIAAGFGFNRALRLPPVEDVQSFPLVRAALDEHYLQRTPDALSTALTLLRDYIPPSRGNYWLAIGVRFSSFEMVQSFALLSVSFGDETEIGLLGLSTLSVPKGAAAGEAVAYAELALRAVIKPSMGLIAVEGRLTDKSYIFARDCHLTGGFAFYSWFDGPNAGDFVITIGGYHPRFLVPSHYPTVPRLGINWRVSSELSVTGEMYYALTPSCLMAGGRLCAVFHAGPIDAWFTAYANFLLNWQPFHYAIDMGIAIGVACSLRIDLGLFSFTLSLRVELSVDLRLWGPAFAGEVYVNLSVISFTIRFGPSQSAPQPLDAGAFVQACLPPATTTSGLRATTATLAEALGAADVLSLRIANGLLREQQVDGNGLPYIIRVVNAHELALTAQSLVPSTSFEGVITVGKSDDSPFGIRPMGSTSLDSKMQVTLRTEAGDTITGGLVVTTLTSGVPDALWGKSSATGRVDLPSTPEATTLKATVGVRISCAPAATEHPLPPIALAKLKYDDLDPKPFDWLPVAEPDSIEAPGDRTLRNTIWGNAGVDARRRAILGVIARVSPFELYAPQLERLSTSPDYFQAEPELAAVERYETPHGSVVA
jgi:hypothetical protein